jgi:2-keto-4-pentenoate hydratase/2-oxohepta-3-ene-1,7-dioic acid hydratase in catechol pathway
MRYARILHEGRARYGAVEAEGWARLFDDAPWAGGAPTGELVSFTERTRLAPVAPSKIVCVGKNYAAHAREMGAEAPATPLLFLKAPSALLACGAPIELPPESARVDHEGELGLVIGATLRRASVEAARAGIFGLVVANDVTARDLQRADGQWARAKSFDTFCPVGPYVVDGLEAGDLGIEVHVGDALRQRGRTADMITPPAELVAFVSRAMTLQPGDLILTGTPEGVGPLIAGDVVRVTIDGVGSLENPVIAAR